MPNASKYLLHLIISPLKLLTQNHKDHQSNPATALNLDPYIKAEASLKPQCFYIANNRMTDTITPPTLGGSHTTASSYDVRFTEKMNMKKTMLLMSDVFFMTKTDKQCKT